VYWITEAGRPATDGRATLCRPHPPDPWPPPVWQTRTRAVSIVRFGPIHSELSLSDGAAGETLASNVMPCGIFIAARTLCRSSTVSYASVTLGDDAHAQGTRTQGTVVRAKCRSAAKEGRAHKGRGGTAVGRRRRRPESRIAGRGGSSRSGEDQAAGAPGRRRRRVRSLCAPVYGQCVVSSSLPSTPIPAPEPTRCEACRWPAIRERCECGLVFGHCHQRSRPNHECVP
jgi:hypothetical protein